jgi:zinc transport system permease protein
MAVGIIFIYLTPGYAPNLMSYLFGSILTVTSTDLILMGILALVTVGAFMLFYRTILFISFDEEYARSHNAPVETFNYLMLTLVALVIVINIRVAGIILVISYLTIPQSTANLFVNDLKKIIIFSTVISFTGSMAGLFLSYYWNIPSGATIIFVFVLIFMIARFLVYLRNLKSRNISISN